MKKLWPPIALWLALLAPALALLTADRWLPMTWRAPGQFGWLALLPVMALFYVWALRRRERVMALFVEARLLPDLASGIAPGWQWLRMGIVLLAFTAVVMALARPRWGSETIKTSQGNLDVVLAIDTSKSMLASDLKPNRLERTKLAAKELKSIAPTDRFAVMPFAGAAFLQCPLTSEEGIFRQNIEAVRVGSIPLEGTSLARLIETAAPPTTAVSRGSGCKGVQVSRRFARGKSDNARSRSMAHSVNQDTSGSKNYYRVQRLNHACRAEDKEGHPNAQNPAGLQTARRGSFT